MKNTTALIVAVTAIILLLIFALGKVQAEKNYREAQRQLNDSLSYYKDKTGRDHARISVIDALGIEDLLHLETKDTTILKLQKLVSEYKPNIVKGGSATILKTVTKYDTVFIRERDTIYKTLEIMDSVSNKWISAKFGFSGNKTLFSLKIINDYSVIIGSHKTGFFKPKKFFIDVVDNNPYSKVKSLRTYQRVSNVKSKFGIGPFLGYGIGFSGGRFVTAPTIGIGVTYSLISF